MDGGPVPPGTFLDVGEGEAAKGAEARGEASGGLNAASVSKAGAPQTAAKGTNTFEQAEAQPGYTETTKAGKGGGERGEQEKEEGDGKSGTGGSYWWVYLIGAIIILIILFVIFYYLGQTCQEEEKDSVLCLIAESVKTLVDAVGAGVTAIAENIGLVMAGFFAWISASIITPIVSFFTGGSNTGKPGPPGQPGPPGGKNPDPPKKPTKPKKPGKPGKK